MVVRWTFHDTGNDLADWTAEVNPREGGSPSVRRNVGYKLTTAADGQPIVYEGQAEPKEWKVSGVLHTQTHYEKLSEWAENDDPIEVTDDLGRVLTIMITEFTPTRKRSAMYPWKHDYELSAIVLNVEMP